MNTAHAMVRCRAAGVAYPAAGCLTLLVIWEMVGLFGIVPRSSLPPPGAVARAFPTLVTDPDFLSGAADSAVSTLVTVVIGAVAGVLLGLIASSRPSLLRPTMIVVNILRSVPATALIPIGIIMMGLGTGMKVSIALYAIVWPILINTVYGVAGTEPLRLKAARSLQWSWSRRQATVVLPSALPSILTGVRLAVGIALIVVISTELLGARTGVGTVLVQYTQANRSDVVYGGVLLLGVVGAALFSALLRIENRLITWGGHG